MNRLLEIGFEPAGHWVLEGDRIVFELTRHVAQANILYAFVCDGEVMYVGKTIRTLAERMYGYQNPGKTQTTNIRNNQNIRELLASGSAVDILALPDSGLMHYGVFHINLAAALEDDIIRQLDPVWNGGKPEKVKETIPDTADQVSKDFSAPSEEFKFILQPTYFRSGFFNVGIEAQRLLGADGEMIELFLGDAMQPVLGTINRRANSNGTPRIMGGVTLRGWFREHANEMEIISAQVYSPTSIRLVVDGGG